MQMVPQKSAGKVTKSKESHRHACLSSSQMSVLLLVTSLPSIQVSYAKQPACLTVPSWDPEESSWQPGFVCILCVVAPLCPRVTKNGALAVESRGSAGMKC